MGILAAALVPVSPRADDAKASSHHLVSSQSFDAGPGESMDLSLALRQSLSSGRSSLADDQLSGGGRDQPLPPPAAAASGAEATVDGPATWSPRMGGDAGMSDSLSSLAKAAEEAAAISRRNFYLYRWPHCRSNGNMSYQLIARIMVLQYEARRLGA